MTRRANKPDKDVLRIVAIGGGTGLSTLLHGLKQIILGSQNEPPVDPELDLTAVVTVTDDGGSSGRLRRDFDVLPPGDIRNCMVAMCEDEALLSRLFQYRFTQGRGLKGHSFGNLFLTALSDLTGDFHRAVQLSSEVLASCGRIYPSTPANVTLQAVLASGETISGETRISKSKSRIIQLKLNPARCRPMPETLEAIRNADLITMGPGSLFTSVIPNLLVKGISEAMRESPATKAYFVNLMWQPGETTGFRASDHVQSILSHSGPGILDYAIVNTKPITAPMKRRYARELAKPVENDEANLREMGVDVIGLELASGSEKLRHDATAIAAIAMKLAREGRARRLGILN